MSDGLPGARRWLSLLLGVVLAVAIAGLVLFVVAPVPATPADTEFYLLNESGTGAGYPTNLSVGESGTVLVSVENHEHERVTYDLIVRHDGRQIANGTRTIADGARWTRQVEYSFDSPGQRSVIFLLYRDGGSSPYRRLALRLTVSWEP